MKRKGPPNQYFVNQIEAPVENIAHDNSNDEAQPVDDEAAGDKEYKVGENTLVINAADGPSTSGEWQWSEFLNENPIDARGTISKNNPLLKNINISKLKNWSPVHFFDKLFPWNFIIDHVIPGTNASLKAAGVNKPVTINKMRVFLGVCFLMSLHPQYSQSDFFAEGKTRKCNKFWNPPYIGKWIGKGRFNAITHNLHLTSHADPTY